MKVYKVRIEVTGIIVADGSFQPQPKTIIDLPVTGIIVADGSFQPQPKTIIDLPVKSAEEYEDISENLLVYLAMGRRILR